MKLVLRYRTAQGNANLLTENSFGVPASFAVPYISGKIKDFDAIVLTSGTYGTSQMYSYISNQTTENPGKAISELGKFCLFSIFAKYDCLPACFHGKYLSFGPFSRLCIFYRTRLWDYANGSTSTYIRECLVLFLKGCMMLIRRRTKHSCLWLWERTLLGPKMH